MLAAVLVFLESSAFALFACLRLFIVLVPLGVEGG